MARLEDVRNEYREAAGNVRYMGGLRLAILSFFAVFVAAMLKFIWDAYRIPAIPSLRVRGAIPFVGLIGTALMYLVDRRVVRLYDIVIDRAIELEEVLDIPDGAYSRLRRAIEPVYLLRIFTLRVVSVMMYIFIITVFTAMFIVEVLIRLGWR